MKKSLKIFFILLLFLFFISTNLYSSVFTFDIQTCLQNILQKMQDYEHYAHTVIMWEEDLNMYKHQFEQIKNYYKQIEGVFSSDWEGFLNTWNNTKELLQNTSSLIGSVENFRQSVYNRVKERQNQFHNIMEETVEIFFGNSNYEKQLEKAMEKKNFDYSLLGNIYDILTLGADPYQLIEKLENCISVDEEAISILKDEEKSLENKKKDIEEKIKECQKDIVSLKTIRDECLTSLSSFYDEFLEYTKKYNEAIEKDKGQQIREDYYQLSLQAKAQYDLLKNEYNEIENHLKELNNELREYNSGINTTNNAINQITTKLNSFVNEINDLKNQIVTVRSYHTEEKY